MVVDVVPIADHCCTIVRGAIHRCNARYGQRQTLRHRRLHRNAQVDGDEDVARAAECAADGDGVDAC